MWDLVSLCQSIVPSVAESLTAIIITSDSGFYTGFINITLGIYTDIDVNITNT